MNPILLTLVKLLASSALLTGFYFLLFRGKSSYTASRIFLLCIPLVSVVLSLVNIQGTGSFLSFSSLIEKKQSVPVAGYETDLIPVGYPIEVLDRQFVPGDTEAAVFTNNVPSGAIKQPSLPVISLEPILIALYIIAVLALGAIAVRQMGWIYRIRRRAERRVISGSPTYFSREVKTSFSVLRSIYVNPASPDDKMEIIINHERQHILHRHYIDLALSEFFTMLMWFNPFVWIIRRELRSVHEFQVDHSVLSQGVQMRQYMLAILEEAAGAIPVMANGLKSSLIKKRFLEMKNGNKIRHRALRIALTVPFAATLLVFFAFRPAHTTMPDIPEPEIIITDHQITVAEPIPEQSSDSPEPTIHISIVDDNTDIHEIQSRTETIPEPQTSTYREIKIVNGQIPDSLLRIIANGHSITPEEIENFVRATNSSLVVDGRVSPGTLTTDKAPEPEKRPATIDDIPGVNYADCGITVAPDGRLLDPDGKELENNWVLEDVRKYNAKLVSNKRTIVNRNLSSPPANILRIERGKNETRVIMAANIYWPENWLFFDKGTCLIDKATGDRYMVRDIEGDEELGRECIIRGMKGKVIEQVLIFPPLGKNVKVVDFYEPDNYTDVTSGNNGGGLRLNNIKIAVFEKKEGKVIR